MKGYTIKRPLCPWERYGNIALAPTDALGGSDV